MHSLLLVIGPDPAGQLDPYFYDCDEGCKEPMYDWYEIGGRWSQSVLKLKEGQKGLHGARYNIANEYNLVVGPDYTDFAFKEDVENLEELSVADVLKFGEWHHDPTDEEVQKLLADVPGDTPLWIIDYHH